MKNKIIFNIVLISLIFIVCELCAYFYITIHRYGHVTPYFPNKIDILKSTGYYPLNKFKKFERNENNTKLPILLLGCSYTYGELLEEDKDFSEKLGTQSGRHIYNMGMSGQGPMAGLTLLEIEEKNKTIDKEPEYIIYTYMEY